MGTVIIGVKSTTVEEGQNATYTIVCDTHGAMSFADAQIATEATLPYEDEYEYDNTLVNGTVWVRFPGDADDNGFVDITDFAILGKAWFATYPDARYDWQVDYDGDGTVDVSDFSILGDNWFKGP